jgi:hypothetical protein
VSYSCATTASGPLLVGRGKQVFADGTVPTALRLIGSVTYPNGTLHLAYEGQRDRAAQSHGVRNCLA